SRNGVHVRSSGPWERTPCLGLLGRPWQVRRERPSRLLGLLVLLLDIVVCCGSLQQGLYLRSLVGLSQHRRSPVCNLVPITACYKKVTQPLQLRSVAEAPFRLSLSQRIHLIPGGMKSPS